MVPQARPGGADSAILLRTGGVGEISLDRFDEMLYARDFINPRKIMQYDLFEYKNVELNVKDTLPMSEALADFDEVVNNVRSVSFDPDGETIALFREVFVDARERCLSLKNYVIELEARAKYLESLLNDSVPSRYDLRNIIIDIDVSSEGSPVFINAENAQEIYRVFNRLSEQIDALEARN